MSSPQRRPVSIVSSTVIWWRAGSWSRNLFELGGRDDLLGPRHDLGQGGVAGWLDLDRAVADGAGEDLVR